MFRVVIPARYASARLPGKVLLDIAGKTMLQRVYEQAAQSGADEIIIATDDARVAAAAAKFTAAIAMTDAGHASGTDRIAQVARLRGWEDDAIVVNVQADEPLIPPALIAQVARELTQAPDSAIATLVTPITSLQEFLDPNVVKAVADARGRALYFSRAPVPWERDAAPAGHAPTSFAGALRHVGIYAYRVGALRKVTALAPSPLEEREKLEQLRALENGLVIRIARAVEAPGPDVNTAQDLARVAAFIAARARGG